MPSEDHVLLLCDRHRRGLPPPLCRSETFMYLNTFPAASSQVGKVTRRSLHFRGLSLVLTLLCGASVSPPPVSPWVLRLRWTEKVATIALDQQPSGSAWTWPGCYCYSDCTKPVEYERHGLENPGKWTDLNQPENRHFCVFFSCQPQVSWLVWTRRGKFDNYESYSANWESNNKTQESCIANDVVWAQGSQLYPISLVLSHRYQLSAPSHWHSSGYFCRFGLLVLVSTIDTKQPSNQSCFQPVCACSRCGDPKTLPNQSQNPGDGVRSALSVRRCARVCRREGIVSTHPHPQDLSANLCRTCLYLASVGHLVTPHASRNEPTDIARATIAYCLWEYRGGACYIISMGPAFQWDHQCTQATHDCVRTPAQWTSGWKEKEGLEKNPTAHGTRRNACIAAFMLHCPCFQARALFSAVTYCCSSKPLHLVISRTWC